MDWIKINASCPFSFTEPHDSNAAQNCLSKYKNIIQKNGQAFVVVLKPARFGLSVVLDNMLIVLPGIVDGVV